MKRNILKAPQITSRIYTNINHQLPNQGYLHSDS